VNHQDALDHLVQEMTPSPIIENNVHKYKRDVTHLRKRIERLTRVVLHLRDKRWSTPKEKAVLNRYRSRIARLSAVLASREHMLSVAHYRITLRGRPPSILLTSDEREP
jgi:hypothetical protein